VRFWCPANNGPKITATDAVRGKNEKKVILPGITTPWTRNPQEELLFRRELPAHRRGIHVKNFYSAEKIQLRNEKSTEGMEFHRK
jgi:hypothetical protein